MQNFLFYYKPSSNIKDFEVYDSIKAVTRIIDTRIKNLNFEIVFDIASDIKIRGIRNEWMQVWMNIISNALAAAQKNAIEHPCLNISITDDTLRFSDNCGGIEEKVLANFHNGIYTGLGIKICQDIVSKHKKSFHIQNLKSGVLIEIIV